MKIFRKMFCQVGKKQYICGVKKERGLASDFHPIHAGREQEGGNTSTRRAFPFDLSDFLAGMVQVTILR
jgi:hypothetical protein